MKNLNKFIMLLTLVGALAHAEGLIIPSSRLANDVRENLAQQIRKAKSADPKPFQALESLAKEMPERDAKKRGRLATIGHILGYLGEGRALPLIEMMAFEGPSVALSPSASLSLKIGLIESLGKLKDKRALPVLTAILHSQQSQTNVYRSAAEALGRMGSDEVAAELVSLSKTQGAHQLPVISGMGSCRHLAVATRLAQLAESAQSFEERRAVLTALSDVGNAWAWSTESQRGSERAVRALAAKAALALFLRGEASLETAASNALMVIDAPETQQLIAAAKVSARPESRGALAQLEARFLRNPTRVSR